MMEIWEEVMLWRDEVMQWEEVMPWGEEVMPWEEMELWEEVVVEIWEEEGEQDSEWRDGPGGEIEEKESNAQVQPRWLLSSSPLKLHGVGVVGIDLDSTWGYSPEGRRVKANNLIDEKLNSGVQYNQTFQRRPGVEIIQLHSSEEPIFGELCAKNIGQNVRSAEKSCIAISHSKKKKTIETPKRKYRTKRLITLDDLQQLFGRKRVDAAKTLGGRMESHQKSSGSKPPEVLGEKETSTLSGARQDAVTVKALYGEDIARFQLSSESGVVDLKEAVAKRLELEVGSFNVKYQDEDQEWVLISCDEDLQGCLKFSSLLGNQVIRLLVTDKISNAEKSLKSCRGLKRKRSLRCNTAS
ncbi:hypothetical protein RHMOL_Rhmol07G0097100 [Rhododendron molle]|uniref:Uncharacterized protein n=1 Tax=Rhododendron molle TaxID=49168 RepID=A0ACC0MYP4_RHOML|nr:hypothetical protein RHMOL_Rhmol07G0097100 [Rhododendron molle]